MNIQPFLSLCEQCCLALSLLENTASRRHTALIPDVSECHRRASSILADLHAELFRVFIPPFPRAAMGELGESLHALMGSIFGAALVLPHTAAKQERTAVIEGLHRMAELLRTDVASLARLGKSKSYDPPDTYRFYAEGNKLRAALALTVWHGEQSLTDRAANEALFTVARRLEDAHSALLSLMLQSV
jgi:hypothetical protein